MQLVQAGFCSSLLDTGGWAVEQEGKQKELLAKEWTCKGYSDSFATAQVQATHIRYCKDAIALREGEQSLTEAEQKQEEEESPYHGDGDDGPNEILRHTFTKFPGARA